jgi:hypothetical protein
MKTLLSLACIVCSIVLVSTGPALAGGLVVIAEPSSLALIAAGAAAVAWAKFRRR